MRILPFRIAMRDLRPRFPQPEAQGLEQPLALPNAQIDGKLPAQIGTQRFAVPQIGGQTDVFRWLAKNLTDDLQVLLSQPPGPPRSTAFLETSQPGALKGPNPVLQGARCVAKHGGGLPAGHTLRHEQDCMQAVIIPGFIGPANLVLQRQHHHSRIGDRQWPHTNMKPQIYSVRNYL